MRAYQPVSTATSCLAAATSLRTTASCSQAGIQQQPHRLQTDLALACFFTLGLLQTLSLDLAHPAAGFRLRRGRKTSNKRLKELNIGIEKEFRHTQHS